jgi:tripartite-type tricarboxylate transporter receptor subunit TctC
MKRFDISRSVKQMAMVTACAAAMGVSSQAQAQAAYPNKPIRMIIPLAAGSAVDVAARLLAQKMSVNMGQPIVIENITGAAGIIGADRLAKAAPDGYTIGGFNDSILTMVPNLNPNTPFNPINDFSYITQAAIIDFTAAVPMDSPFKTIADLVAAAKAKPDSVTYSSGGNGSPQHLAGAMLGAQLGINLKHVPYKGASQAAQDAAAGLVNVTFQGIATVSSLVKANKLRMIGVPAKTRHPEYPNVPTFEEVGVRGFEFSTWFALTAPPGVPKDIITRLNREAIKALADPEIKSRYAGLGLQITGTTPDEFVAITKDQLARYGKVIRDANIKGD